MDRGPEQELTDLLLILYAIDIASRTRIKVGLLVLQKVLFLSALRMKLSGTLALAQSFYRWHYGPMSDEVYQDVEKASSMGLLEEVEGLRLTERAEQILGACGQLLEENSSVIGPLEEVASNVESIDELLEDVYGLSVHVEELDEDMKISEVPEGTHMLTPLWRDEASDILKIDASWIETLDILLDPEADEAASEALDKAKKGKFLPLGV